MIPTLEIDINGNVKTLYTDEIDLYSMGVVREVRRASHINFNEDKQVWVVVCASSGKEVFEHHNREKAIEWEIENYSPGGRYYEYTRDRDAKSNI